MYAPYLAEVVQVRLVLSCRHGAVERASMPRSATRRCIHCYLFLMFIKHIRTTAEPAQRDRTIKD